MDRDWLAVFESLQKVYADGAYSNISINEAVSRHRGCRASFVRTFAKGTLRDSIRIDYILDALASKGVKSIKQRTLTVLRMGIYAIDKLSSVPDHAAVSESVELAKKVSKGSSGFVNGILRAYLRRRDEFAPEMLEPHIRYSFSEPVFSLLSEQYGGEAAAIAEALNRPAELFLRVNTLKTGREEVIAALASEGIEAKACEECSEALRVSGGSIASGELYKNGFVSIQSLSSMIAVKAFGPAPGSRLLDLCAAPGGKTCYAAELMGNVGSITACDIHPHRLELIRASAERTGARIDELKECDSSVYEPSMESSFDYVMADVPCSGLGVIASKPEIKLTTEPADYPELIRIQAAILDNAISYAKEGGLVMYSTCTLNKEENEGLVKQVLSRRGSLAGLVEMNTLLPYNGKVGFFYSIIRKNAL